MPDTDLCQSRDVCFGLFVRRSANLVTMWEMNEFDRNIYNVTLFEKSVTREISSAFTDVLKDETVFNRILNKSVS